MEHTCHALKREGRKLVRCDAAIPGPLHVQTCSEHDQYTEVLGDERLYDVQCDNCGHEWSEGEGWEANFRHSDGSGDRCSHKVCSRDYCWKRTGFSFGSSACGEPAVGEGRRSRYLEDAIPMCKRHLGIIKGAETRARNRVGKLVIQRNERTTRADKLHGRMDLARDILKELGIDKTGRHSDVTITVDPLQVLEALGVKPPAFVKRD